MLAAIHDVRWFLSQEGDSLVKRLLQSLLEPSGTDQPPNEMNKTTIPIVNETQLSEAADEISCYLKNSFGNRTRIDYGSGHELNFVCFLYCLYRVGFLLREDFRDVVIVVFNR